MEIVFLCHTMVMMIVHMYLYMYILYSVTPLPHLQKKYKVTSTNIAIFPQNCNNKVSIFFSFLHQITMTVPRSLIFIVIVAFHAHWVSPNPAPQKSEDTRATAGRILLAKSYFFPPIFPLSDCIL